jgi:ABC-type multidrug transport system fused ATPase/permease subunit
MLRTEGHPDTEHRSQAHGESFTRLGEIPAPQASSALSTIAAWRGTVLNHDRPIIETELPIDGSRFEGIVSPVVRRPVFAIRLRPRRIFQLDEYVAAGILTTKNDPLNHVRRQDDFHDFLNEVRELKNAEIIRAAVRTKENILVVGSTGSGKTTFVNACLDALARLTPHDRVISNRRLRPIGVAVQIPGPHGVPPGERAPSETGQAAASWMAAGPARSP